METILSLLRTRADMKNPSRFFHFTLTFTLNLLAGNEEKH